MQHVEACCPVPPMILTPQASHIVGSRGPLPQGGPQWRPPLSLLSRFQRRLQNHLGRQRRRARPPERRQIRAAQGRPLCLVHQRGNRCGGCLQPSLSRLQHSLLARQAPQQPQLRRKDLVRPLQKVGS